MRSSEIRKRFLSFFEQKNHKIVPSSSLVPNDPTLLLTAAGMVQFKPIFQGEKKVDFSRAASCQKCVRTTDIDNVGHTARHLTFFEMLGNFSFGDYYKKEAAKWAWEFLTEDLKMNADKFWITIFKDDDEAFEVWNKHVGISPGRIVRLGEEDNFWSAGPTGPCGPCSELLYDLGEDRGCERETCGPGCDCDRFLEVWNLVFMQYDRDEQGKLNPLPKKNIDTGIGLERTASILQGKKTNFETDIIKPIILKSAKLAKIKYRDNTPETVPLRIIADHARAITFLINDGVLPSNEGRGYVLRRLIRRAVRYGRLIGIEELFINDIIDEVIKVMKDAYPEIEENKTFIDRVCGSEEERFSKTLKSGLAVLSDVILEAKKKSEKEISGEVAFQLYDTYGFPLELTIEIATEENINVDTKHFEELMEQQKSKARAAWTIRSSLDDEKTVEAYNEVSDKFGKSEFLGYETEHSSAKIQAIIKDGVITPRAEKGDIVEIVLEKTPFYAERGGQIGDIGNINGNKGKVEVDTTQLLPTDVIVHSGKVLEGSIETEEKIDALVNKTWRDKISRNHTATHLLQWALRQVLGEHVRQSGSYVGVDYFRFDFTHMVGLSNEEIERIEHLVNSKIMESYPVKCFVTSYEFAKESGAMALFGEKYSDFVRVVEINGFSRELCGGTHVGNTSEIGVIKILTEGSIGANLRRIEAVTSQKALDFIYEEEKDLKKIINLVKSDTEDVVERIGNMVKQMKLQESKLESMKTRLIAYDLDGIIESARKLNGISVIIERVEAQDLDDLRKYVDLIREKLDNVIIVLGASSEEKALLVSAASPKAVKTGFHSGNILKEIAPIVGGGGGGRPEMAQAGGKNPNKIQEALDKAWKKIQELYKTKGD